MDLREELQRIYDANNQLTPELVVEEASSPDSKLHRYFEWDDTQAAKQYRFIQADNMIRRVKIVWKETPKSKPVRIRAFLPAAPQAKKTESYNYKPTEEILVDDFQRRILFNNMVRDFEAFKRKYRNMEGYSDYLLGQLEELAS
ncbi:hypothetical protein QP568_09725 [Propionimicrobium lymphophilum]|uniref:Uncharacterized protein n=1 Tax=Propionimicrobium lymphophilum ACS-093-V-SCH5 TaxID=883161 RepID=S2WYW1_9ACTN|nr:hypothetical protein [Propionimicrobium lymphophilum]EPD32934.1 hypothetical protein HMPREF9306_01242 [Propionimicrobium lymphophilum ACS-093-V-SCH5]MDK7710630.1 hypothetical protein [Propionimicrobium lymphophilum]MDK7734561.1 hypothetical protein [Propionimicrobium lymphophilum]